MGAGEIEGLGCGKTGYQAIRNLGRGRDCRRVPGAAQTKIAMDFVGHQDQVAFGAKEALACRTEFRCVVMPRLPSVSEWPGRHGLPRSRGQEYLATSSRARDTSQWSSSILFQTFLLPASPIPAAACSRLWRSAG